MSQPQQRPGTQQRNRQATEHRLLAAAEIVFAESGYEGASVLDIAQKANANVALINRYFGNKEGLFLAVTERFIRTKQEDDLPYPPRATLFEEVRSYLHHRRDEDTKHLAMVRLMVSRIAIDEAFRKKVMTGMSGAADRNLRIRLEDLQKNGSIQQSCDLDQLFSIIAYFSFSANFFGSGLGYHPPEAMDTMFESLAAMVQGTFGE